MNSKWIKDLNVKHETMRRKHTETLQAISIDDFLDNMHKIREN